MFTLAVISSWTTDAHKTLTDARKQCADAHASLEWTALSLGPELVAAVHSARDSVLRLRSAVAALDPLVTSCVRAVAGVADLLAAESCPDIALLRSIVATLEHTPIPHADGTLADFVNSDDVEVLLTNVRIHHDNGKLISAAVAARLDAVNRQWQTLSRHAVRAVASLGETLLLVEGVAAAGVHRETNANVRTILRENDALENELAAVLHLLTKHYDQCVAAMPLVAQDPRHPDLRVLDGDAQELPVVRGELSALCDIIATNRVRASRLLEPRRPVLDCIARSAEADLDLLRLLRIDLVRLVLFCNAARTRHPAATATHYAHQVSCLTSHYVQYHQTYCGPYLKELHRQQYEYPRQFWRRIDQFVQQELSHMYDREHQTRQNWADHHGPYLPRQLPLPGPEAQPVVVQIVTEALDVDNINATTERERHLLQLMSAINKK